MSKLKIVLVIIWSIILVAFFIFLFFYEDQAVNYYSCKDLEKFKLSQMDCVIKRKFIDRKNHSFRTIDFVNCESMVVIKDTSSFYDFISEGDSITKPLDTDTINVYREGQIYNFKIYFGCSD
jgi:hypothetical protein